MKGDVEHDAVVPRVRVVLVLEPPSGGSMDFHVAPPVHPTETDVRILEVRTGVRVEHSRI